MKIKFINKHNSWYEIDEGSVLIRNFNEELDSMTIRISHLTEENRLNDLEPFDICLLQDEEDRIDDFYMSLDTIQEIMINCDNNNELFNYEITLFSQTKELEGIVLPSLSITRNNSDVKTIHHYLQQYNNLFGTKIRVVNNTTQTKTKNVDYDVSSEAGNFNFLFNFDVQDNDLIGSILDLNNVILRSTSTSLLQLRIDVKTFNDATGTLHFEGQVYLSAPITSSIFIFYVDYEFKNRFNWVNKYIFGHNIYDDNDTVQDRFNVECPEMQWNMPTFREVINDLFMVRDCIPVVRNNVIDFIDLTKKHNEINKYYTNFISRSRSSSNYISELKNNIKNVMSGNDKNNLVVKKEFIPLTGANGYITSENINLYTQLPIYNVKKFEGWILTSSEPSGSRLRKFPINGLPIFITEQLKEKGEFDICPYYGLFQYIGPTGVIGDDNYRWKNLAFEGKYKELCLYYTRGSNIIEGLNNTIRHTREETQIGTISTTNLLTFAMADYCNNWVYDLGTGVTNSYYCVMFYIEYETLLDCVASVSKDDYPSNKKVAVDNQTNSYVDAYAQGFLEYQKANRLGNEIVAINAFYRKNYEENHENDEYNYLIDIGDYYEDSVVYQTQYEIYKEHIKVNAFATKDYILRDYFTGVKSKIRSWKIAEDRDAFTRFDLEKYYYEFSFNQCKENIDGVTISPYYFLSSLYSYEIKPIKYCGVQSYINDEENGWINLPSDTEYYLFDLVSRIYGNSIVYHISCYNNTSTNVYGLNNSIIQQSNISVGVLYKADNSNDKEVSKSPYISGNATSGLGGIPVMPFSYTNNYGECLEFNFVLINELDNKINYYIDEMKSDPSSLDSVSNSNIAEAYYQVIKKPVIDEVYLTGIIENQELTHTWNKDNKEIANLSIQFEFCRDDKNIAFTKEFIERQEAIRNNINMVISGSFLQFNLNSTYIYAHNYYDTRDTFTIQDNSAINKNLTDIKIDFDFVSSHNNDFYELNLISFDSSTGTFTLSLSGVTETEANYDVTFNIHITALYYDGTITDKRCKVYMGNSENYDFKEPNLSNTTLIQNAWVKTTSINGVSAHIEIKDHQISDFSNKAFYITTCDENPVLLLAINKHDNCYLNVLDDRNKDIYQNQENQIIVDDIKLN